MARAEGDNRPGRYIEVSDDGREQVVYRASALTLCPSAFAGLALGHTPSAPPPAMQKAFDAGHEAEPLILSSLEDQPKLDAKENAYTVVCTETKAVVELTIMDTPTKLVVVRGALDDVGYVTMRDRWGGTIWDEEKAVIEAKNFGMGYWSTFLRHGIAGFPNYEWQATVYMLGMARKNEDFLPELFACRSKDTGKILVQWLDQPPKSMKQLRNHIFRLEVACEEAIERGEIGKCEKPTYPCPMWHLHDVAIEMPEKSVALVVSEEDADYADLSESVADWLDAKKDETKLAKKYKAAKDWRERCAEVVKTVLANNHNIDASVDGGVRVRVGSDVVFWHEEQVPERVTKAHTKTTFNIGDK